MELTVLGSASAAPNPGSASSSYILEAEHGQLLLECGHGAASKLLQYSSIDRLAAILISHMHPDHFFDLVPLKYAITFNGYARLPLYLPPGGEDMLEALAEALKENGKFWSSAYELHTFDPKEGLEVAGMHVAMAPSHHYVPAWAMTFASVGPLSRRFAYTSDTSMSEKVVEHVRDADLLMAEASIMTQNKPASEQGHLTPYDAGCMARLAGAKRLVVTHYPAAQSADILSEAAEGYGAPCDLAMEGARFMI